MSTESNIHPSAGVRAEIESRAGVPVEIRTIEATANGAALYRVEGDNGEVRFYVEGETGEVLSLEENLADEEALEEFRKM
jgi:uncharacterized membrane protein YkoI